MKNQNDENEESIYEEIPSDTQSCTSSESDDEEIVIPCKKRKLPIISSSDEDDEITQVQSEKIAPVEDKSDKIIQWERNGNSNSAGVFSSHFGPTQCMLDLQNPTPYDICCKFISNNIIDSIVFQTNLYAQQTGKKYTPTNEKEIRAFIGINFIMGIVKLPSYRDYWSSVPYLHNNFISQLMTVNRFGWLLSHIHLNDNILLPERKSPNFDKLYKVRPLLDKIQENFKKNFDPSCCLAIDESMIKFKGRSSIKQYLPKKPIKRGYKVWMLADKSGYCYKFEIYTGKVGNQITKNLGEKVVNNLTTNLDGKEHTIYFDNYFTSVNLMEDLKSRKINACGVVVKTRKHLPKFRKMTTRGEYESFVSNTGIVATKWMDNKEVHILSNFHNSQDQLTVQRRDKQGKSMTIPCPSVIIDYNNNMNSVDKFDQLLNNYKLDRRSKKWWHRIMFHFFDTSVINAYIIYKQLGNAMILKEFKGKCAEGFVAGLQIEKLASTSISVTPAISNPRKPQVSIEIRRNESKHQPIRCSRRRCAYCSTKKKEYRTSWSCTICKVPLCMGKKMCFNKFHN